MENKINVVFDLSKISFSNNEIFSMLLNFISKFILDSNELANFYFLECLEESKSIDDFDSSFNIFKEMIIKELKVKKVNDEKFSITFGYFKSDKLLNDSRLVSYEFLTNNEIDFLNNETILFFSFHNLGLTLESNNFFYYYLNFDESQEEKIIRKNLKISPNFIDKDNYEDITFSKVNYEFLTFLEQFDS